MKKENIFHYVLSTVFAAAIVTGASHIYAWTGPTATPPNNNAPAPINVSPIGQVKQGSLFIDGLNASNVPYLYGLIVAHGNVGIGVTDPGQKLVVGGKVQIKDGTEGAGKVLTSDASGVASWTSGTPVSGIFKSATVTANKNYNMISSTRTLPIIKDGFCALTSQNLQTSGPGGATLTQRCTVTQDVSSVWNLTAQVVANGFANSNSNVSCQATCFGGSVTYTPSCDGTDISLSGTTNINNGNCF